MSPEERDRIRLLKRKYDQAWIAYDRFGDRLPNDKLEEYHQLREEYQKLSEEQIKEALNLSKAEQVSWCRKYLVDLVIAHRIQLAQQLQPEPEDLWADIQAFIDEEIETFDASDKLPVQIIDTKNFKAKQLFDKQMLKEPASSKIAQLILQLSEHVTDEEVKKRVLRAKKIPSNHTLLKQINLISAVMDYLDEIAPEEKLKQKPQRGFLNTLKSALTNKDNEPDIPTLDSIFDEIDIWKLKSIEELGHHQMAILGSIEVLTRFSGYTQKTIDSRIESAYDRWVANYYKRKKL